MPTIDLKANHKAVKDYYAGLEEFHRVGVTHETAVRAAFQRFLEHCCRQSKWTFVGEYKYLESTLSGFVETSGEKGGGTFGNFIDGLATEWYLLVT